MKAGIFSYQPLIYLPLTEIHWLMRGDISPCLSGLSYLGYRQACCGQRMSPEILGSPTLIQLLLWFWQPGFQPRESWWLKLVTGTNYPEDVQPPDIASTLSANEGMGCVGRWPPIFASCSVGTWGTHYTFLNREHPLLGLQGIGKVKGTRDIPQDECKSPASLFVPVT